MSTPDGHLIRQAFLTKYGYSPDLTYQEILREFQRRYDLAQELRQQHAGVHKVMLVIEGMDEGTAHEAALGEREVRKFRMEGLRRGLRLRNHGNGSIGGRLCGPTGSRMDPAIMNHNYCNYLILKYYLEMGHQAIIKDGSSLNHVRYF